MVSLSAQIIENDINVLIICFTFRSIDISTAFWIILRDANPFWSLSWRKFFKGGAIR